MEMEIEEPILIFLNQIFNHMLESKQISKNLYANSLSRMLNQFQLKIKLKLKQNYIIHFRSKYHQQNFKYTLPFEMEINLLLIHKRDDKFDS